MSSVSKSYTVDGIVASRTVICAKTVCLATNVGAPKWSWGTVTYISCTLCSSESSIPGNKEVDTLTLLTNGLALWVCDKVDISVRVGWDIAKGAGISLTHGDLVTTVIQVCLLLWHCHLADVQ